MAAYQKIPISDFLSLWDLGTENEMDTVGYFNAYPDNFQDATKLVGNRPFTDGFVLIRTNELVILQVLSSFWVNNGTRKQHRYV